MTTKKTTKKSKGFPLLKFAASAALASYAGYFYFTHKEDVDNEAKKRIHELAKKMKESKKKVEERVEEIWGDVNEEAVAKYLDIKGHLLHALQEEELERKGRILKEKYDDLVDDVLDAAKKKGVLDAKMQKKAAEMLKMDWEVVKKVVDDISTQAKKKMKNAKKVACKCEKCPPQKVAKKAVKKVAKKPATKKSPKKK